MNPLLLDFPDQFDTDRLTIRAPRPGDGKEMHDSIVESQVQLAPWMPWVHPLPTLEQEEATLREQHAKFLSRENLMLLLFLKGTGTLVGSSGLHRINWEVPRFEIGYWVRTRFERRGYIKEAVIGISRFAFDRLGARRVEIRVDDRNERSWRIPERLGFELEGILRCHSRDVEGRLRDTRIYSQVRRGE